MFGGASLFAHELQAHARARSHEQTAVDRACPCPARIEPLPEMRRATGRKLFLDSCAHCHGADARGDEGPDLPRTRCQSDRRIATVVRSGIKGEMPSFAKKLRPEDIAALIGRLSAAALE